MADYVIVLARSAEKEVLRLPLNVSSRVVSAVDRLATNPRPSRCKKLKNARNLWRIRVGDYRILQRECLERIVDVAAVRHRREAYQ
ncbi:MAG: type II toxin-antitoxin system RelE/ParE family toxin [Verrucomicrobia bacterium]|nr:type II toxin-antitoxin system RelE/ParE family toxin [Verrucomicrobiota bacterium]